jgi:hypothetical protein
MDKNFEDLLKPKVDTARGGKKEDPQLHRMVQTRKASHMPFMMPRGMGKVKEAASGKKDTIEEEKIQI